MCGEDGWAIAHPQKHSDELALDGVLVDGTVHDNPTARASVFASFCPRAVLVAEEFGVLRVQMDAAVLDQGVVVLRGDGHVDLLSEAGPRVIREGAGNAAYKRLLDQVQAGLHGAFAGERVD